jgi:hypothetical protein
MSLERKVTPKHSSAPESEKHRAFQERTRRQFSAFRDCWEIVTERAKAKAVKLMKRDELQYRQRSFDSLVSQGMCRRMATQIHHHVEWLPEDCGRWLELLGVEPDDIQWILKEVSKRSIRAAWVKATGFPLKPGTRL